MVGVAPKNTRTRGVGSRQNVHQIAVSPLSPAPIWRTQGAGTWRFDALYVRHDSLAGWNRVDN